ncbi:MAG: SDR family oxidoreductase [Acidimicrobiia bacterium]|nr:SDR family oxidoreductase [Acidimicrobiia bacterium]
MSVVSLVTGAGSGIGAATCRVLAERGDRVVCVDIDADSAQRTADEVDGSIAVGADVTDAADLERAVTTVVEQLGGIHNVVTCAGIEIGGHALDVEPETFRRILDVNVTGSFLTAQAAARAMRDASHGGSIVLIGSLNSQAALPGASAYVASKGGVLMLGKALALDFAPHGIRVNIIGPGVTDTPMSAATLADPERSAIFLDRIPLGRAADPAEIGRAAAFLTSADASYITGAFLPVDGGWLAK